jgi:thioredoxin reductase (NADPH)
VAVDGVHDVIVIGGGAAGVCCALECFDIQLDTLLIEAAPALGGQFPEVLHSVRNVATGRFANGAELQRSLQDAAAILGDRVRLSEPVTSVSMGARWIETSSGRVSFRSLVVASGTREQHLAAAPDGAFGGDITYQLETDPGHFKNSVAAVIGGGDSAALDALALAADGSTVTLVHRSSALNARDDVVAQVRAEPRIDELPGWELAGTRGDARLEGVELARRGTRDRRTLPVKRLVVKIGRVPNTGFLDGQLELDDAGAIVVDHDLRTSNAGVFAAGDVVSDAYPRVAAAIGQGSLAARSVLRYLQGRR